MAADNSPIDHVSDTALWVAHYRELETERPDALFQDPFAKILVGEKGRRIAEGMKATSTFTAWTMVIRTVVIDDFIQTLIKEGVDTIINLGAGLDTRPYRMALPESLLWIEVDYPHMIAHKELHLAKEKPRCLLERVALDLADREKRRRFLAETAARSKKTLIITEGVLPYLEEEQVGALAEDLNAHAPFQFWIAEYLSPEIYRFFKSSKRMKQMGNAPFRFFPADWFGFFAKYRWIVRETKYLTEESIRLKRKVPTPWWAMIFQPFMGRERTLKFQRFSGYTLLKKSP